MTHLWLRAEQRDNETRVGLTPVGAKAMLEAGFSVTVEASDSRVIPTDAYRAVGCDIARFASWPDAPDDAIFQARYKYGSWGETFKWPPCTNVIQFGQACNIEDETTALCR